MTSLAALHEIYARIPHFTREQIEAAQPDYWHQRLERDLRLQELAARAGVNAAHLDTADQAGILDRLLKDAQAAVPPPVRPALDRQKMRPDSQRGG